ncbi:MAG: hypothetical protein ACI85J_001678 [Candidatus Poriferisodalaceae bacterium]|jgi:hypothetical protein|tara:strand:- start:6947 stop:7363 length:417 start_codon:yes stop_codon:yes gene_type:complete
MSIAYQIEFGNFLLATSVRFIEEMAEFVGIYNADSGIRGELTYALIKLSGKSSCSLCEITHGWNPFGRNAWRTSCRESGLDLTLIHRNNASAQQLNAVESLPAILKKTDGNWSQVVSADELLSAKNDFTKIFDLLNYS